MPDHLKDRPKNTSPILFAEDSQLLSAMIRDGLTKAGYLNLRSVSLAYSLPKNWLKVLGGIKSTRINLTAENLFMIKARQGLNPQANFTGLVYNEYMPARTITIGLNVGF